MMSPLPMSIRSTFAAFTLFVSVIVSFGFAQSVGEPLSPFSPGNLDIHHINTGEGTAAFLVLPDSTNIKRVHPGGGDAAIDYAIVSHFHGDHMGGFAELLRTVRVRSFLDRGWPDYGAPLPFNGALADLYKRAIKEHVDRYGMKVARFKAGAAD
jgi:phosphoribosyl 1,2-cyclic phosphodiesterase